MPNIAIFYHALLYMGDPPALLPRAIQIVEEQWSQIRNSNLERVASEIIVGINGGEESRDLARLIFPPKAKLVMHGLQSKAENLTIVEIEKWVKDHPDWFVLYCHAKGCTHPGPGYGEQKSDPWRRAMMFHLVDNWQQCYADLAGGAEACGCNWLTGMGWDHSQNIFGGNFWWATSNFLRTLPSIYERDRIKTSGIAAADSRFEAEVWIGNGPRVPRVKVYHPGGM